MMAPSMKETCSNKLKMCGSNMGLDRLYIIMVTGTLANSNSTKYREKDAIRMKMAISIKVA